MKRMSRHKKLAAKARRQRGSRRNRSIRVTYSRITPESAEDGDFSETGWIDEEGSSMEPDKYDRREGLSAVDKAVKFLKYDGATEASSSYFHPGVWYSTGFDVSDYRSGESEERSYHLDGFTAAEQKEIWERLRARR